MFCLATIIYVIYGGYLFTVDQANDWTNLIFVAIWGLTIELVCQKVHWIVAFLFIPLPSLLGISPL
jgi:hypothetical protein